MKGDPAEIRKRIQALRKSQDPRLALSAAKKICEALARTIPKPSGLKIALYRPLAEEVELNEAANHFQAQGARLYYPRILDSAARTMDFVEAPPGVTWIKGSYGIEEPSTALPAIQAKDLELIIVPGVAFSPSGERIGRGAGYYDRALKGAPCALKVALAFDFQVLSSLPQHSDDQKVDWVLTERQDLRTPRVAAWLKSR